MNSEEDEKKRTAKDGGEFDQQRLAPALRKNGQNTETENSEINCLLDRPQ